MEDRQIKGYLGLIIACAPAAVIVTVGLYLSQLNFGVYDSLPFQYLVVNSLESRPSVDEIAGLPDDKWLDPRPGKTWKDMLAGTDLSAKFKSRTLWFRYQPKSNSTSGAVVIGMPFMYQRSLEFFLADSKQIKPTKVMDASDYPNWYSPLEPTIWFKPEPSSNQTIFVRTTTVQFLKSPFVVLSDIDFQRFAADRGLFMDLVKGGMGFMIVFSLCAYFGTKNSLYLFAAFFHGFLGAVLLGLNGEIFQYFPQLLRTSSNHRLFLIETASLAIINFGLAIIRIFPRLALLERQRRRWETEIVITVSILLSSPFIPADYQSWVALTLCILLVAELALFLGNRRQSIASLRTVTVIGSLFWGAFGLTLLGITGQTIDSLYIDNAYAVGEFLAAFVLTAEIARRTRQLDRERLQILQQLKNGTAFAHEVTAQNSVSRQSYDEIEVSIMFIDIVSFSIVAERRGPEQMFSDLSRRLRNLTQIVEQHGGVIDRSLGDGMLCFFSEGQEHHAIRAFRAATAIHQAILADAKVIDDQELDRVLLPVRIGIHTDKVVIGNTAGQGQIDFTMVGQGVNFANNLEQACVPFQIMLSESTCTHLLAHHYPPTDFSPTLIAIKHRAQLAKAFRCNPCALQAKEVVAALTLHYKQLGTSTREYRYALDPEIDVRLESPFGDHEILDFSLYGFRTRSKSLLGQNAQFEATLVTANQELRQGLADKMLQSLTLEVRWSLALDGCFEHGFKVVGGNQEQAHFRVALLLAATPVPTTLRRSA